MQICVGFFDTNSKPIFNDTAPKTATVCQDILWSVKFVNTYTRSAPFPDAKSLWRLNFVR